MVLAMRRLVVSALLLSLCWACRGQELRTSGLDGVLSTGELRVVVRPGFLHAPPPPNGMVDEVALLRQLAARLRVRLRWVECARHDRVLPWLSEGRGDLAVARFSPASLAGSGAGPTSAVDWVEDLLVAGPTAPASSFEGLRGAEVHLHRSVVTPLLAAALAEEGLRPVAVPEDVTLEQLLDRVRRGRYQLTVVDSMLLDASGGARDLQVVGPVSERRPLVWAVRDANQQLGRAVDDFLFAEKVLWRVRPVSDCRDLAQVRQQRVLRLITRNSPTTCTVQRGGMEGFEYDLALAFAGDLGVRLDLSIPPPGVDPVTWLEEGYGDVLALHEPVALEDEGRLLVSRPYLTVDLVSVLRRGSRELGALGELAGVRVAAARPVASLCRMLPLEPELEVTTLGAGSDALTALLQVSRGEVEAAAADRHTVAIELANRPELELGPVVLPDVPLVWLLNVSSPLLYREANAFLGRARSSGLIRELAASELGAWDPRPASRVPEIPAGALTPYDELLQTVGQSHDIDWRLLASVMYEESRFDPAAVGPGGSAGLFQLMPSLSYELGIKDPHNPTAAANAAAWYLRWLMDRFSDADLPDQVAMAIASYNVGLGHLYDARKLAGDMGLDAGRWLGNVETALVILDDPEVARQFAGGVCRCRRAVGYTRRILRRYRAYTDEHPPM